ncbi:MAG: hypothetical protein JW783_06525 [Bacteroidales bacterium]|nr:hypothetical protein [Bacteroidales bacterium]MBN2750034.1 hypothetical protein [Bacteroidales bacterium]
MIRNTVKVFIYTVSVIVVVTGIAFITGIVFNDAIVKRFTSYFNSTQNFKVKSSNVKFSLLSRFPKASIQFSDVTLYLEESALTDTLIQCNQLFFELDVWKLLDGDIEVQSLVAHKGVVNVDLAKIRNAAEIKTNDPSNQNISLNKIILEQVEVNWIDTKSGNNVSALAKKLSLTVTMVNQNISVNALGNVMLRYISTPSWKYDKRIDAKIETKLLITNNDLTLEQTLLQVSNQSILVSGKVNLYANNAYTINIATHKLALNSLSDYFDFNNTLKSIQKGNLTLKASLSGDITHISSPALSASFIASDIRLNHANLSAISILTAKGAINKRQNTKWDRIVLKLDHINISTGKSKAIGTVTISNLKKPSVTVDSDFHLDLSTLFSDNEIVGEVNGTIKSSFQLHSLDSIIAKDLYITQIDTRIGFKGITYKNYNDIDKATGDVEWKNNQLAIAINHGTFKNTPFSANIRVTDALSFFGGKLQKPIEFSLSANKFIFNDLFKSDNPSGSNTDNRSVDIWKYIPSLKGDLDVREIEFATWNATSIAGSYELDSTDLVVSNATLSAFNGKIKGNVSLHNVTSNNRRLVSNVLVKSVDVNQFFKAFNSFDQTAITDKNVYGDLSGEIELKVSWEQNKIDYSSIESMAKISLHNGRLANMSQFKELSKFLKYKDIETVSFSKLENEVLILNNQVLIPSMLIKSNALDLTLSGNHRFDGRYSYKLKFELGNLLSNKWKNSKDYEYEEDTDGSLNVFIKLNGSPAGVSVSYDSKSARENFRQNLSKEGQTLKTIFKEEFGLGKQKSGDSLQNARYKKNKPTDTIAKPKPRFKIEWDELDDTTHTK